jgi:hypothetical protein
MPPNGRDRGARFQPDQRVAGPERVRRARHRLDGEAAPVHVGERVAGEHHQVLVGLVDPQCDPRSVGGVAELDAGEPVLVPLEVGERVVEDGGADRPRPPEVVLRTFDLCRARRQPTRVRRHDAPPGHLQDERIDGRRAEGQIRMRARSVGTRARPDVRGGRARRQALIGERVLDLEPERERIPRLRLEREREHRAVGLLLLDAPRGPARETVDRVARRRFRQRQLELAAVELVGAVLQPVGPGNQHLAPGPREHISSAPYPSSNSRLPA